MDKEMEEMYQIKKEQWYQEQDEITDKIEEINIEDEESHEIKEQLEEKLNEIEHYSMEDVMEKY